MPSAEQVAASWRAASPAAVHPELGADGEPISDGSAQNTIAELLAGMHRYDVPNSAVLDYGGGPGRLARLLVKNFARVIVADTNPAYLTIAARAGVETMLVKTVPDELPDVDVILCVNLFLHLPTSTALELLPLFAEHGRLIALQMPLYDYAVPPATWTSVGTWTVDGLNHAAELAGLEVLEAHANPGRYRFGKPGPNHARLHFLKHAE